MAAVKAIVHLSVIGIHKLDGSIDGELYDRNSGRLNKLDISEARLTCKDLLEALQCPKKL